MTRAGKPTNTPAGINGVPGMPLAAFNPWNWLALMTPSTSSLAALKVAESALQAWRANSDAMRAALRARQDSWLAQLETPLTREAEAPSEETQANGVIEAEQVDFVTPMLDVTRAYGRVGKAFIVAQRDTLRAFTQADKPH
jgi:hypothetical protein